MKRAKVLIKVEIEEILNTSDPIKLSNNSAMNINAIFMNSKSGQISRL